jgi:hypothetical protein
MLILGTRPTPEQGVCFAWTPKYTPDGWVWLETVAYQYHPVGYGDYSYTRLPLPYISNDRVDLGGTLPEKGRVICVRWHPDGKCDCG